MEEDIANAIRRAYMMLVQIKNNFDHSRYRAMLHRSGQRGRPTCDISEEQLSFLLERGLNIRDMSSFFGVSSRTVERGMSSFWLSVTGQLLTSKFLKC